MLEFLLRILNGHVAAVFRLDQKVARDQNRANREKKRLARKRSRAARRERAREAELVTRSTHTCKSKEAQLSRPGAPASRRGSRCECGKSFRSRKRRSHHAGNCPLRKARENPTLYGGDSTGLASDRKPAVVRSPAMCGSARDVHRVTPVPVAARYSRVTARASASDREAIQPSNASVTVGSRLSLPPSKGYWVYDSATGWTEKYSD